MAKLAEEYEEKIRQIEKENEDEVEEIKDEWQQ